MRTTHLAATRRRLAVALSLAVVASALMWVEAPRAEAFSVDAAGGDFTFDYSSGGNGTLLSGGSPSSSGAVVKFSSVATLDGVEIDAIVTTELNGATVSNYDNIGNASGNKPYFQVNNQSTAAGGYTAFTFDFYEHGSYTGPGTGVPVTLRNVAVTSIDIDSPGIQFQDFVGYQSFVLNSPTSLVVVDKGSGVTRFEQPVAGSNNSNIPQDAVQVTFDAVSSFTAKFGNETSGQTGYFGITFEQLADVFAGNPDLSPAASVSNPSNRPPVSNDTTRYVVNGEPSVLQLSNFGSYSDPDGNPFVQARIVTLPAAGSLERYVAGTWQAVTAGDDIPVSDIQNGRLRFTGSVDDSLTFRVNDGLVNSTSAYTMSLLMADQPQTITFANPGTKLPTDPTFASGASSSSGFAVTLTSLTPGVCTVSGLNIDPVTEGQCTIVATQDGDRSFGAADPVTQTFPVSTKTPQTITGPSPGDQPYTGSPTNVVVSPTASSGLPVTLLSLTPEVCTVSGYTLTLVDQGNCTIRNTQAGDATYAPAPQVQYTFRVANYTLSYDANGADAGSVPASQSGAGAVTVSGNTGSLVRDGFTFGGWSIGGQTFAGGATYTLAANVTATAIWTAVPVVPTSYTLSYNANGADAGSVPVSQSGVGAVTVAGNTGSLVRDGFTFGGWSIGGQTFAGGSSYTLAANVTATAIWTAVPVVHTLTFTAQGADGGTVPLTITDSGLVTLPATAGSLVKDGYVLTGWRINGVDYPLGATFTLTGSVTADPIWQAFSADEPETSGGLAFTGSNVSTTLALTVALFSGGAALFLVGRLRRLGDPLG